MFFSYFFSVNMCSLLAWVHCHIIAAITKNFLSLFFCRRLYGVDCMLLIFLFIFFYFHLIYPLKICIHAHPIKEENDLKYMCIFCIYFYAMLRFSLRFIEKYFYALKFIKKKSKLNTIKLPNDCKVNNFMTRRFLWKFMTLEVSKYHKQH